MSESFKAGKKARDGMETKGDIPVDSAVGDDLGPEVKKLIERAKERGFVTYDELNKVLPDDMVSPDKLDAVLQKMDDLGIELVESSDEEGKDEAGAEPVEEEREFEGVRETAHYLLAGHVR